MQSEMTMNDINNSAGMNNNFLHFYTDITV